MKLKSTQFLINAVYQKVRILFWFSILLFTLFSLVNYIDLSAPLMGDSIEYTVRGEVSLVEKDWTAAIIKKDSLVDKEMEVQKTILFRKGAFVKLDYPNILQGLTLRNISITLLSVLSWWIWAIFLYQLMKLLKSFKEKRYFENANITRMRIMAIVFFASPLLIQAKNILFSNLVASEITFPGMYVGTSSGFWIFPNLISLKVIIGFTIMLFILILAQVFAHGFVLKQENDLTI